MAENNLDKMSDAELIAIYKQGKHKGPKYQSPRIADQDAQTNKLFKIATDPMGGTITSAYRDPEYNAKVGGVPNSAHTKANARDYSIDADTPKRKKQFEDLGLKTLIHDAGSGNHLHVEGTPNLDKLSDEQLLQLAGKKLKQTAQAATVPQNKKQMSIGESVLRGAADAVPQAEGLSGILRTIPQFRALADIVGGKGLEAAGQEFTKGYAGFDPSQF